MKKFLFSALFILLLAVPIYASDFNGITITFSETGHFFDRDISVGITASQAGARIFYTLDGSVPTAASSRYSAPLNFRLSSGLNVVTLRAVAVCSAGTVSRPFTHTYFIGRNVFSRFDTMVFSITSDAHGLFDYDEGILVPGRIRSDFIRENPRHTITPLDPANFNMRGAEWERLINVEAFEANGERVLTQEAGMRVHGGWSRGMEQKSLRIIARRDISPEAGRFHFPFFGEDLANDGFGTPITRYDTIILRNGGNDRYHGMLRNEVGSVLVRNAGFSTVTPVRPAAVFLNGEYYGFAWLQVRMNDQFFEDRYSAPTREFDNVSGGERSFDTGDERVRRDLNTLQSFTDKNLLDDATFAQLQEILDVENFLWYYAFQIFMGAEDWPHNNIRIWRYTGEQAEGIAPQLDGRWRYAFFDLDWTLGLYGDSASKPTFARVLQGNDPRSPLLRNVLTRPDMAELFTIIMNDIAANVVTAQNVQSIINDLVAQAGNEMRYSIAAEKYPDWFTWDFAQRNQREMVSFAQNRSRTIFGNLSSYFNFPNRLFDVNIEGGEAIIGTVRATSSRYFEHLTIPVSPILPPFTAFAHWELNGRRITTPNITISAEDAVDGVVTLRLVTRPIIP